MPYGTDCRVNDKGHGQAGLNRSLITAGYLEMERWLEMQPERGQVIYRHRLGEPTARKSLRRLAAEAGRQRRTHQTDRKRPHKGPQYLRCSQREGTGG